MRGLKLGCTWRMHPPYEAPRQANDNTQNHLFRRYFKVFDFANNFVKELALCDWSIYPIALAYTKKNSIIKSKE